MGDASSSQFGGRQRYCTFQATTPDIHEQVLVKSGSGIQRDRPNIHPASPQGRATRLNPDRPHSQQRPSLRHVPPTGSGPLIPLPPRSVPPECPLVSATPPRPARARPSRASNPSHEACSARSPRSRSCFDPGHRVSRGRSTGFRGQPLIMRTTYSIRRPQ